MKLHLPKILLTAVLAAYVGGPLQAAEEFESISRGGDFWASSYTFSFVLNDVASNGSVVAAYWGATNSSLSSNAFTVTYDETSQTYTLTVASGNISDGDIDSDTTFSQGSNGIITASLTGLKAGVLYTVTGVSSDGSDTVMTLDSAYMDASSSSAYNGKMNNNKDSIPSGVNSAYAVNDGAKAIVWTGSTEGASAASADNWQTITNTTPESLTSTSVLVFEAVDTLTKNVDVTGLGGVDSIYVADNYSFNTTEASTLSATNGITIYSGKTLTLTSTATDANTLASDISGNLAINSGNWISTVALSSVTVADDAKLTLSDGGSLTYAATSLATINSKGNITTSGGGYVILTGNETSLTESVVLSKNYYIGNDYSVNGKGYDYDGPAGRSLTIGTGNTFTVDGAFSIVSRAIVDIDGGSLEANSIKLGHGTESGSDVRPYWGKITMASGSIKTGTITFQTNKSNVIDITGGTLEFTSSTALNKGSNTASTVSIVGTGSSDTERVILKATSTDWTLDGEGLSTKPVVGNVTIDADNTYGITLANAALSGSIVSNAKLALGSGITVGSDTSATLTTGENGVIVLSDTIQSSGSIELGGTLQIAGVPSDFVEKAIGSKSYVLASNSTETNEDENGFIMSSASEYWIVQGTNSTLATEGMTISDADGRSIYKLTADTNGIYLTTGDNYIATDKYYITTGDVTVIGTGADNATGADSYVVQGGNMQLAGGTVNNSEIVFSSGSIVVGTAATVVLDNIDNSASSTSNGEHSNVFDASMYSGTGTLELKLYENNGRGFNLSNFEGDIVISKASGADKARFQVNSSTLHENASITLQADYCELVFNSSGVTLSNDVTVLGTSDLHVNGSNEATITSTIDGSGTLIKQGGSSTLNLNGTISVGTFQTGAGTTKVIGGTVSNLKSAGGNTYVQGGSVTTLQTTGGTAYVQGGSVAALQTNGGTVNVSGGAITDVAFVGAGTINFQVDGAESASYTVSNITTTTSNNYNRHINVSSGVALTVGTLVNQWGMGTLDVDGSLTATSITMTSGGDGDSNNIITGDGTINTAELVITNAGNYRFSVGTLNITKELRQDRATMSQYGGTINVNGLFNAIGGTMNLFAGQMNVNHTEATNKIAALDMAGANDRAGKLNLAAGASLEVSGNFWLGGTSVVTLLDGASLSKDGMTITGKGESSELSRLSDGDGNAFNHGSANHEVKNSAVSITKENADGNTLALKLTNSSVANDSTSRLTVSNTANTLTGVYANKGEMVLNFTEGLQLQDLVVKSGAVLSVGASNSGTVGFTAPVAVASTTDESTGNTATNTATLYGGATIKGNLDLSNATSLTLDGIADNGEVKIEGTLTLSGSPTLTLSGDILNSIANATGDNWSLDIFQITGGFFVGTTELTDGSTVELSSVFASSDVNINFDEYYLGFNVVDGANLVYVGKMIPEPTTATLSLLALAALAARRRRR